MPMRFREFRLPFAGVLLLAASGLTFAFATNEASESPGTVERTALTAATSIAVVRRAEHDRHAVTPDAKRPAAAHVIAARTLRAPVRSQTHVPSPLRSRTYVPPRPKLRAVAVVAKVPVRHSIVLVAPKHAPLPSAAIASQRFTIVRFVGSKRTIARGDSVMLCARATGAEHLRIVPLGPIDPRRRTCRIVRPRKTTTYTLLAQSPEGGNMTQNVTIAVHRRTPPSRPTPPPLDHDPGV